MEKFKFYAPTKVYFGKDEEQRVGNLHRPEPQADRLPRLCRPGQERQPDL